MLPDDAYAMIGTPSPVFRVHIIATVLALIQEAWQSVLKWRDVDKASEEKVIAGTLYRELWEAKKKFGIEAEPPLIIDEGSARRNEQSIKPDGFIDFKFVYAFEEQTFFGMECKRINSANDDLARKYVNQGLMRYVTGQYCPGHDTAAMLGFVIDGNMAGSVSLVNEAVMNTQATNKMRDQWNVSKVFDKHSNLYTTSHRQHGQASNITILHFFQEL